MKDFAKVIRLLKEYKERYGDCLVPVAYITEDGIRLGKIVSSIRSGNRKTSTEEKAILDSLGFVWKIKKSPISFEQVIRLLKEYKEKYGDCLIPQLYTTEDGIHLGNMVSKIRRDDRKISAEQRAMLDSLGFVWKVNESPTSFEQVIRMLKEYKEQYGDCLVPRTYTTIDEIHLGRIVSSIRIGDRKTTPEEKAMLDSIGFVWKAKVERKKKLK